MARIGPSKPIWNEKADYQSEHWHDWEISLIKRIMKDYGWKNPLGNQANFQLVCGKKLP